MQAYFPSGAVNTLLFVARAIAERDAATAARILGLVQRTVDGPDLDLSDDEKRWYVEAEAAALRSRDAATSDDNNAQALWRATLAGPLPRKGEREEAIRFAGEAIVFADRTDELDNQGLVRLYAAEAYRRAGLPEEEATALQEALARFEQKGNAVMAERTQALLTDLDAKRGLT